MHVRLARFVADGAGAVQVVCICCRCLVAKHHSIGAIGADVVVDNRGERCAASAFPKSRMRIAWLLAVYDVKPSTDLGTWSQLMLRSGSGAGISDGSRDVFTRQTLSNSGSA